MVAFLITIEHEDLATVTTIMDQAGEHEDIQIIQNGETVYIRQFNEDEGEYDLVIMSPTQFTNMFISQDLPEGTYKVQ